MLSTTRTATPSLMWIWTWCSPSKC
jgi:hypothetical protein